MNIFPLTEGRRVEGDYAVYPNSLLFRAGEYADKGITITREDLKAAAEKFLPLAFNSEHDTHGAHKAILTGIDKYFGGLGGPRKAWIDPADPDTLRGEVAVPLWLDENLETKSLSMEINRADKTFTGAALTYTPRVSEAAMMSAYAEFAGTRHNTPEGQMLMQDLHDVTARGGAVCDRTNTAKMASQHESTAVQKIHDMTTDHGATCKSGDKPSWAVSNYTENDPARSATGEKTMLEKFKVLFHKAGVPQAEIDTLTEADFTVTDPAQAAQFSALQTEVAALKSEREATRKAALTQAAADFAAAEVAANRAYPAEAPMLAAQFAQAAEDDAATPTTVTFSTTDDGTPITGSRVDALRALCAARPAHGLTQEQARAAFAEGGQVLTPDRSGDQAQAQIDAQVGRLLQSTGLGKDILAAKNGSR